MGEEFPSIYSRNFQRFIEKFRKNKIIEKKPLCRIILLGSYFPPEEKEFLLRLRDDLREDGFVNTWLVESYPTYNELGIREKSIFCVEYSHINFFVITFEGAGRGETVELEHIINNASRLSFKTTVFYEVKYENDREVSSLSLLQEDGLISTRTKMHKFTKDNYDELFQLMRAEAWNFHYHYVIREKKY